MPRAPKSAYQRVRDAVDRVLHHPWVELTIVGLILGSVAVLMVEVAFPEGELIRTQLRQVGDTITRIFIVELALRFWVAHSKRRFLRRYVLDIVSVLPLAQPLRLLRVLLLLRLFRAGALLNRRMSVFGGLLKGTINELMIVATLTTTVVLVGTFTLANTPGAVTLQAEGFEGSLWFSVLTLLGGEPIGGVPETDFGRAITLALMLGGMTVFGIFIGTVSAGMVTVLSKRMEVNEMDLDELRDHVVVCGWNHAGPALIRELFGPGNPPSQSVVVITEGEAMPEDMPQEGIRPEHLYHYSGDYTRVEVLEQVGITRASSAIMLTDGQVPRSPNDQDARTVLAALTVERLAPDIFCCAQLNDHQHEALLRMAGVEEIVIGDWFTGVILGAVGRNQGLVAVLTDILTTQTGDAFHKLTVPRKANGKSFGEVFTELKARRDAILVSVERAHHDGRREVAVNPPWEYELQEGDVLVVISKKRVKL
ncbi:MAG: NAD-binding protein [Alphaproteobacteria bacterium]|nr:NAD-binding protein [Alphaproteobacteria bacterium]